MITRSWRAAVATGVALAACGWCHGQEGVPEGHFVVMPWELRQRAEQFRDERNGFGSLAECGFNTAAFVRPEDLPACRKLGLKALVRLEKSNEKWTGLPDEELERRVRELVADTAGDDTVIGYFLRDEPGVGEFEALGKAVAWVKKLAPGKLAYINLYPDYATLGAPNLSQLGTASYTEYLERYVREVRPQFISYDNYRVQSSGDLRDAKVAASYYRNLLEVRRVAQEHGLPFWHIVSGNQIRRHTPVPSPANLLMQAYTTLASGARGLTWFTYYSGVYRYAPVTAGNRTATWSYLRMVNEQVRTLGPTMTTLRSTGVYFTSPAPAEGLPTLPGKVVEAVETEAPMMVGEFEGPGSSRWAMVVNLDLERSARAVVRAKGVPRPPAGTTTARATTQPDWDSGMRQVSPVDGSLAPIDDGKAFWLTAGQGVLLKLP